MKRLLAFVAIMFAWSAEAGETVPSVEFPPPDFSGPLFVDANGCAFVRAEIDGWVLWVQKLDAAQVPYCGTGRRLRKDRAEALAPDRV